MSRLLLAISLDCLLAQAPGTQKWATQVGTLKNKGTTDSSPCLSPDGSLSAVGLERMERRWFEESVTTSSRVDGTQHIADGLL